MKAVVEQMLADVGLDPKWNVDHDPARLEWFYGIKEEKPLSQQEKIEAAQKAVEEAQRHLAELLKPQRFKSEPVNGTTLAITKTYGASGPFGTGGHRYTYVARREAGKWYVTGSVKGKRRLTWDELVEFMGNDTDVAVLVTGRIVPRVRV